MSVCETVAAITTHAREVGEEGMVYGGGLYNIHGKTALCGAKVAWDTRIPFKPDAIRCRECRRILEARS